MAFLGFGRVVGLRRQLEQEKTRTTNLKRMYAAAQNNRLTSDWISQATSADSEVRGSIRMLRNRARQLVRDSDFAKSALRAVKNNVVGTGIKVQAQVRMQRGGRLAEEVNANIEDEFKRCGSARRRLRPLRSRRTPRGRTNTVERSRSQLLYRRALLTLFQVSEVGDLPAAPRRRPRGAREGV